ncbi:MAG: hypothetical protein OER86_05430, partial [Phycisphaerae bacterium]|nr:hypothetical protein [Phycisphaerae bacterium]
MAAPRYLAPFCVETRRDVTLELADGSQLVGYVSDRQRGGIVTESYVRLIPTAGGDAIRIGYDQLRA